jgi:uncharacterized protein (TIGR02284 family)
MTLLHKKNELVGGVGDSHGAMKKRIISNLNRLIAVNIDRSLEYRKAMNEVEDKALKPVFQRHYQQSLSFRYTLEERVRTEGGIVSYASYPRLVFAQLWADLNSLFPPRRADVLLEACEQREMESIEHYKKITAQLVFPPRTAEEIYFQVESIESAHREIVSLSALDALFI